MPAKPWRVWNLRDSAVLVDFLITRGTERAAGKGHLLSPWVQAKKKCGKGSRQATCVRCGQQVYILPYGIHLGPKMAHGNPGVSGPGVHKLCIPK